MKKSSANYSIQGRLLKVLLVGLPIMWLGIMSIIGVKLWQNMSQLGDTQMTQLSGYLLATSRHMADDGRTLIVDKSVDFESLSEELFDDIEDDHMGFAIWDSQGRRLIADDNGETFHFYPQFQGFTEISSGINPLNERWRLLYISDKHQGRVIAVGQNLESRQELILTALVVQLVPALVGLVLFLLLVWWSVRRGFAPLASLGERLQKRDPADSSPLDIDVPKEVRPLVVSLNHWFVKISDAIAREERFTADASHELKSPLTALKLQADMLGQAILSANLDDEHERALYEHHLAITAGIKRSNHLVSQLLTLAKLSAADGQQFVFDTPIDWQKISDTVLSQSNLAARQKHSKLSRTMASDPLALCGDEVLIEILLTNLIDNAIRYCPEGSNICLEIGKHHVAVRDDGLGVDEQHLARLSERFFRPAGQVQSGSGLGLSIVMRICQMHGLKVQFDNLYQDARRVGFCVTLSKSAKTPHKI
ncbi:ATP-binding protein [Moraxella marmotae]|uniref:ATP-binding protein n=1 Tax=Moraxella marmotae TaxID=3344520 RepID=UPI0035F4B044